MSNARLNQKYFSINCLFFIILGDIESITQSWSSENVFNRDLGCIVTGSHDFWSAIGFLGCSSRILGSFQGDIGGTPFNLQKLPLKKGIFDVFAL